MALHNSFKQGQSQQQGTRLAAVPTTEDLTLALAQAGKNSKNPIVVSWKSSKSTLVFWLSVTASSGGTDAEWLLQKGDESGPPKNVWNHKTLDTNLIQSLVSAEEEMALKSTSRAPAAPSLDTLNEQRNNSSGNPDWNTSGSNPNAPIVLGGGPAQPQRPEQTPQAPPQWQGNEASGWNAPQPGPDQLGWGQKPAQKPENVSENSSSNPFAGLKATVEEPKPVNPFNSLMTNPAMTNPALNKPDFSISNQTLPQLPEEDRPGSSLPKDDPSVNPYDALTNSGAGVKQVKPPPPPPPTQPPAPPPYISPSAHPPGQHPRVPDFAAISSSGAYPVLQVSPDQALNPKNAPQANANQNKAPFVIN